MELAKLAVSGGIELNSGKMFNIGISLKKCIRIVLVMLGFNYKLYY